ncbi:efflux RND transporter periplasmic adaptor subunit [Paludibacterium yongneupense]|uniref:efflux RND transporter periplasmic adaptor subunit n=1 Tax=Paludibacterium yongneupense TaxID=400061 RepID=UPI000423B4CD|nr:efflux RND transporter periplasmic adaptor subunit [Paludibacterium yongneupense]
MTTFRAHTRRYLLIILLLAVAAVAIKKVYFTPPDGPHFLTGTVHRADIEDTVLASGTLQGIDEVSVGSQASGQVKSLYVQLGQRVKKGQLVAVIDSLTQENSLRADQAALENVLAQKRSKQATLHQAELTFAREQTLLAQDAAARADYESAEATLASTRADIAALDAQIREAQVTVDNAKVDLNHTRITSPIDGTVVAIVTKQGQTVNATQSTPTIVKVAQLDTVLIKAEISEADVTRVKPGLEAYFTILGEPDHRYDTRLSAIEPGPEAMSEDSFSSSSSSTSSTSSSSSSSSSSSTAIYYNGLLMVPNPDGKFRISMTAQVNIVLAKARAALIVPASALGPRAGDGRYAVQVVGADGRTVHARQIRIGINNHVNAQILDGLQEGERVVIRQAAATASTESTHPGPPPGGM